jgi:5-methylcytosine-specific restriction endonuclease McrA
MPWPRPYKAFMQSTEWKRLRAQYRAAHPLCERCVKLGRVTLAVEVHHRRRCFDDRELQVSWQNLEALCSSCHDEITASERRGYSKAMDHAGYFTDPNHPTNRARPRLRFGRDATKLKPQ